MNFLEAFTSISALVKTIESLVSTFQRDCDGQAKKTVVISTLDSAYDVAAESGAKIPFTKNEVMSFADSTIDHVVAFKHTIGEFTAKVGSDVVTGAAKVVADIKETANTVVNDIKQEVETVFEPHVEAPAVNPASAVQNGTPS